MSCFGNNQEDRQRMKADNELLSDDCCPYCGENEDDCNCPDLESEAWERGKDEE